jgi:hypothetical protein
MELWNIWLGLVNPFTGACTRKRTFFWLVIVLIGFTVKFDALGVTSLARGAGVTSIYYTSMLHFFNSTAINLELLQSIWVDIVFIKFGSSIVRINGRCIIVGDGIKIGKEGRKMPGVKWLHQASTSNSKAEYIMGHSLQFLCVLARGLSTCVAVPLAGQIHEGIRLNDNDHRTLLDKIFELLIGLNISETFYFVADKYYCSGRLMKQLVGKGTHLVTMMKKNAVAYYPVTSHKTRRGRPTTYGKKIKLFDLFKTELPFIKAPMPGNEKIIIEYCVMVLLWRPLGGLAQFVLTRHPTKGNAIAMSTDLTLDPLSLILVYSLRFKIEVFFKQAVHLVGVFLYRFWLKMMKPIKRGSGDQYLQFASTEFKQGVAKKLRSYQLFILCGLIAQGLMQYLSIHYHEVVFKKFGTWLRTIRAHTLPSEMVVALAMKNTYDEFLIDGQYCSIFKKFLMDKIGIKRLRYIIPTKSEAA